MIDDKELIRCALLGDQKSQEELSNKFIPIPCAFCKADGSNMKVQYDKGVAWMECQACGACGPIAESDDEYTGEKAAIHAHNTRPTPPVGRCGECKHAYINFFSASSGTALCRLWTNKTEGIQMVMQQNDFCSYFEPREE